MNDNANETIFGIIRREVNDFVNNYIEVVPGYTFSQYQTIKRIHLYSNSKFFDQSLFNGREKIFFNVSNYRKAAITTYLNIDTKDIRLYPTNPKSEWSTFFLEKELKLWMKNNHIPKKLNEMADEAATYGTVVIKKGKKSVSIVDLRRLFLDPTVDRIKNSRFITIKHYYTPTELREKIKDGWDKGQVEAIILKNQNNLTPAPQSYENQGQTNNILSSPYITVYERYGEVPSYMFDKKGEPIRSVMMVAEPFAIGRSTQAGSNMEWDEGAVLFKSEWVKEYPFNDYHYSKTRGRWLGVGVIEELFPLQERFNEMANQKRVAMELSSMHIFQTADATVVDNVLQDLQSGDIIKTKTQGSLVPLVNEERNMQAFNEENEAYGILADKVSFVNDLISGGQLPTSTPATNAAIANQNSTSLLKFKRENFAIFIREFFDEFVLPSVVKDITPEHVLRFTGDSSELQKLDDAHATVAVNDAVFNQVMKTGVIPSQDEVQMLKQVIIQAQKKKGGHRFADMVKDFYGDTDFEFDILMDEEQEPIATLANNTFQLLTAIAQNPTLLENPVTKALIYEWASKVGISPVKLQMAESDMQQQPQQQQNPQQQPQPNNGQPQLSPVQQIMQSMQPQPVAGQ